jgi:hypothetical protein
VIGRVSLVAKNLVDVDIDEVEVETDRAILVFDGTRTAWIPKSQIADTSEVQGRGDSGTLRIPEWLAKDKELI